MDAVRSSPAGRRYKAEAFKLLDLHAGQSVLDVGCGPGGDLLDVAERVGNTGRAVGIDVHDVMIEEAKRRAAARGSSAEFRVADILERKFEGSSFDRCYADRTLQLIERREEALTEMGRLLSSGGHVVVCNPDLRTFFIDVGARKTTAKILAELSGQGWQGGELPNLLRDCGFTDLVLSPCASIGLDFTELDASTPLREMARQVCDQGVIGEQELEDWLGSLEEAIASDRFAFGSTMIVIRGTKP